MSDTPRGPEEEQINDEVQPRSSVDTWAMGHRKQLLIGIAVLVVAVVGGLVIYNNQSSSDVASSNTVTTDPSHVGSPAMDRCTTSMASWVDQLASGNTSAFTQWAYAVGSSNPLFRQGISIASQYRRDALSLGAKQAAEQDYPLIERACQDAVYQNATIPDAYDSSNG